MRVMRKTGVYFGTCPHRHTGTADTGLKLLLKIIGIAVGVATSTQVKWLTSSAECCFNGVSSNPWVGVTSSGEVASAMTNRIETGGTVTTMNEGIRFRAMKGRILLPGDLSEGKKMEDKTVRDITVTLGCLCGRRIRCGSE